MSIHSGLRGEGDLQAQSPCQRDPIAPLRCFPEERAAPQPHWGLGVCGQGGMAVGTVAGMWEMGRGTSTAQYGCAALPPLSPWGTATRVTHWTALEMPSPSSHGLWKSKWPQGAHWRRSHGKSRNFVQWRKGAEHSTGSQEEKQSCEENIEGIKLMSCHWPKTSSGEAAVTLGPSAAWLPARYVFLLQAQETPGWEADGLGRPESCSRQLEFHIFYSIFSIFQHNSALLQSMLTSKKCLCIDYIC